MKNTSVIIMANGLGGRWKKGIAPVEYKQLLPVAGIPLMERTILQVQSNNLDNIHVICPDGFCDSFKHDYKTTTLGYIKDEPRTLLDGILRTQYLWEDRTIILLGDVCYSNGLISTICNFEYIFSIVGRIGSNPATGKDASELFALMFNRSAQNYVNSVIKNCISPRRSGKLWDLHNLDNRHNLVTVHDYTDDCDSPESYQQHWLNLERAATEDDNRLG